MNVLEKEMLDVLKSLKDEYGAFQIKAEFEAEGSRIDEVMRLKELITVARLPLILKTGGVEAITDMYNALLIGVSGMIAPMAETPYAVSKFLDAIEKFMPPDNREDIEFAINIETITAIEKLDAILALPKIKYLQGITVGRGDLVQSLEYHRSEVDRKEILDLSKMVLTKSKEKGLKTAIGGSITTKSIDFIKDLVQRDLLDKYETRKVVFRSEAIHLAEEGIIKALEFELLWLKSKRRYYHRVKNEDEARIGALEKRLEVSQGPQ